MPSPGKVGWAQLGAQCGLRSDTARGHWTGRAGLCRNGAHADNRSPLQPGLPEPPCGRLMAATQVTPTKVPLFADYARLGGTYDEFFDEAGQPRPEVTQLVRSLDRIGQRDFQKRQQLANGAFLNAGVT